MSAYPSSLVESGSSDDASNHCGGSYGLDQLTNADISSAAEQRMIDFRYRLSENCRKHLADEWENYLKNITGLFAG